MNYKFKLSRRMARFRAVIPIATFVLAVACTGDPYEPGTTGADGAGTIRISPDSVSLGVNQSYQFGVETDATAGAIMLSKGGGGRGRGRLKPTIVSLTLTPQSTTLDPGASNRFTATATLSDGSLALPRLTWTATGGSVDSTGLYTAGSVTGTYSAIATTMNGVADTATVTVTASAPVLTQIAVSPAATSLAEGASKQFTAVGKASDGSTVGVSPTFTATGGSVTPAGLYTAGMTPGSFRLVAKDPVTGLADTAAVTVTVPTATLQSVVLTPSTVSLISGGTQQFTATGLMSDSSTSAVSVTWSAAGGTMSSTGVYTAGSVAGSYRVIATQAGGGLADTSTVTVTAPSPSLQAVVLTPASLTLQSGATQQFAVSGRMSDGSTTTVNATYSATGGTITSGGLYTAGSSAGTFRVIATQQGGGLADSASVTVTTSTPPPSGSCARTVDANTLSGLTSAVSGALPGDCINLAPGTYTFASPLTVSRSGTAAQPITIQGAGSGSTTINMGLNSLTFLNAPHVHIRKLRVTNLPKGGWWIRNSSYAVLDSLEVDHSLNELIAVKDGSHHVIIQNSWFHDTGTLTPYYGEAVYFGGSGMDASHPIDCNVTDNQVLNNRFGPNVRSNSVDIKPCADRTTIRGNRLDGTGSVWDASHGLGALIDVNASGTIIEDNTFLLGNPNAVKFYAPTGGVPAMTGTIARNNRIDLQNSHDAPTGSYFGFNRTGATYYGGVTIYCNNVVTNGPFGTNPCTP